MILAAAFIACPLGCSTTPPASVELDGVSYRFPPGGHRLLLEGTRVVYDAPGIDFVVDRGVMWMGGLALGRVAAGDEVLVSDDGRVFVNDVERRIIPPTAPSPR